MGGLASGLAGVAVRHGYRNRILSLSAAVLRVSTVRVDRGHNPPETCIAEVYEPPSIENPDIDPAKTGHAPRGIDVDRNGVNWTPLSGSGHIASFDRSKCRVLNGPEVTGQHCPEGWNIYPTLGPQMKASTSPGAATSTITTRWSEPSFRPEIFPISLENPHSSRHGKTALTA